MKKSKVLFQLVFNRLAPRILVDRLSRRILSGRSALLGTRSPQGRNDR